MSEGKSLVQIDLLLKEYFCDEGASLKLQELVGWTNDQITYRARQLGLKGPSRQEMASRTRARSKPYFNFFDSWTVDSAYVRGLWWADGHITKEGVLANGEPQLLWAIGLNEKDKEILEKIGAAMGNTSKLAYDPYGNAWVLRIRNTAFVNKLISQGFMFRKSGQDISFPIDIPAELLCHFLRGNFDGDGSVWGGNGRYNLGFYGSKRWVEGVSRVLCIRLGIEEKRSSKTGSDYCFGVVWSKEREIRKIYEFLYPLGSYLYMGRKRIKFMNLISLNEAA